MKKTNSIRSLCRSLLDRTSTRFNAHFQNRRFGQRVFSSARALLPLLALAALAVSTRSFAQAPTFNAFVATPKGGEPWFHPNDAAIGDFNGDGKLDALVSDGGPNLRLMLGNGDGTFNVHNVFTTPTATPRMIKAADLNGDGKLDAVFVSPQGNLAPTVLLNTGNDVNGVPQFTATTYTPVYSGLRSVTVGDLNGDGRPDFIVGNAYGSLYVYLNNGDGTFTAGQATNLMPNVGGSTGPGAIADLNGDGKADYVVTSNQAGATDIFFGNGDGTLQTPVVIPNYVFSVTVADVNGDGKPDLLEVNGAELMVYLNSGGGTFGSPTLYALSGAGSVTAADINGDGKLDAVIGNASFNSIAVLLGNGSGAFGAATVFPANHNPRDVSVGDFNGDGKLDIATVGLNDNTYGVLLNTTVFAPPLPTQTLTILGGVGNPGDIAANTEYYNPATGNWQPAYLANYAPYGHPITHPWGNIAGTTRWINYKTDGASDPGAGPTIANTLWYQYRVRFTVPTDAQNATMTFSVKADNLAQVAINGVSTGPTIEGQADQLNADAVFSQNVHPGENTITLNVGDYGGLNGFNFRIDLSVKSSQPLEIVPAAPADTTPPVITAPANMVVEATGPSGAVVTFTPSANDNVNGPVSVTASPASGSAFPLGVTTVHLSASDAAGNAASASFTITVRDTTAPAISAPATATAEATSAAGAAVTFAAAANDIVSGNVAVTANPPSGSTFPLGLSSVSLSATDAAGNTASGSILINVRDTIAPALTVPANQVIEATSAAGAVANFAATASDAVGVTSLIYSAAPGSTFPIGITSVTVTAKDAANNTSSGSFTITVRDTIAPALSLPANQTIEATSAAGAVATFSATATDAVGVTSLTYSASSGSTFPIGTTAVSVTAADAAGNSSSGSFTVTVRDTTAPVISSLTVSSATLWPPNHQMVPITLSASASDAVGVTSLKIISATSNEPDNGLGDGDIAGDIEITGDLTLNLRAERSGTGTGRVYTITVEAKDAAGNASTRTVTVSVPKSQGGK